MLYDKYHLEYYPNVVKDILPGCAIVFVPNGYPESRRARIKSVIEEDYNYLRYFFPLQLKFVETNDNKVVNKIVARKVNIGCINQYCISVASIDGFSTLGSFMRDFYSLEDEDCETVKLFEDKVSYRMACDEMMPDDETDACLDNSTDIVHRLPAFSLKSIVHSESVRYSRSPRKKIIEKEDPIDKLEKERKDLCDKIASLIADFVSKYHQMPPMDEINEVLQGKVVLNDNGYSPLVVNNDLDIILPSYNEVIIPLQPLAKALYFLFLCHQDGIRLVDIDNYRQELTDLYSLIMPNRKDDLAEIAISKITDTVNNESLRQQLSKIKRTFEAKIIPKEVAQKYYISGSRGGEYLIPLNRKLVQLPEVLR